MHVIQSVDKLYCLFLITLRYDTIRSGKFNSDLILNWYKNILSLHHMINKSYKKALFS